MSVTKKRLTFEEWAAKLRQFSDKTEEKEVVTILVDGQPYECRKI